MGTDAAPAIVQALDDTVWQRLYERIYPKLPGLLQRRLSKPDNRSRWTKALFVLTTCHEVKVKPHDLKRPLEDENNRARMDVLLVIFDQFGPGNEELVPAIINCLQDPEGAVRATAAMCLGRMGRSATAAVPALEAALKDQAGRVRAAAAVALWRIDGSTPATQARVMDVLRAGVQRQEADSILALSEVDPKDSTLRPLLTKLLKSRDKAEQSQALYGLARYGAAAKEAAPVIIEMIEKNNTSQPRFVLVGVLKSIDPESAAKYSE